MNGLGWAVALAGALHSPTALTQAQVEAIAVAPLERIPAIVERRLDPDDCEKAWAAYFKCLASPNPECGDPPNC